MFRIVCMSSSRQMEGFFRAASTAAVSSNSSMVGKTGEIAQKVIKKEQPSVKTEFFPLDGLSNKELEKVEKMEKVNAHNAMVREAKKEIGQ